MIDLECKQCGNKGCINDIFRNDTDDIECPNCGGKATLRGLEKL